MPLPCWGSANTAKQPGMRLQANLIPMTEALAEKNVCITLEHVYGQLDKKTQEDDG